MHKEEEYISQGAQMRSCLQLIKEGDEGYKFFFNFINKKEVVNLIIGHYQDDGSLKDNSIDIQGMFRDHFQNIFSC